MNDPDTPPGLVDLAQTAAERVREMNHRTRGPDAFTGPAQLYRLVGELVLLVEGLPQLSTNSEAGSTPNTTPTGSAPTITPTPDPPSPEQPRN